MNRFLKPDKDPQAMTTRARAYLTIGGSRHVLIGGFMVRFPDHFAAATFIPIVGAFPLWSWGAAMIITAAVLGAAAFLRSAPIARAGLVASGAVTLAIGVGVLAGAILVWTEHGKATPVTAILLLSLALKDFAVCTQPIRSPFEPILRRLPPGARRMPL